MHEEQHWYRVARPQLRRQLYRLCLGRHQPLLLDWESQNPAYARSGAAFPHALTLGERPCGTALHFLVDW